MSLEAPPGLSRSNLFAVARAAGRRADTARHRSSTRWWARREVAGSSRIEHFTVDGTLIEAWASHKNFKPKDGPPSGGARLGTGWSTSAVQQHGERHTSLHHRHGGEARRRKSEGRGPSSAPAGAARMENRNGLCVDLAVHSAVRAPDRGGQGDAQAASAESAFAPLPSVAAATLTKASSHICVKHKIAPHIAQIGGRRTPGLDCAHHAPRKLRDQASESANRSKRSSAG